MLHCVVYFSFFECAFAVHPNLKYCWFVLVVQIMFYSFSLSAWIQFISSYQKQLCIAFVFCCCCRAIWCGLTFLSCPMCPLYVYWENWTRARMSVERRISCIPWQQKIPLPEQKERKVSWNKAFLLLLLLVRSNVCKNFRECISYKSSVSNLNKLSAAHTHKYTTCGTKRIIKWIWYCPYQA